MDRKELVRALVMDAIANDFERLDMVHDEVATWAEERGVRLMNSEISGSLVELIRDGLAKAYRLSPLRGPEEIGLGPLLLGADTDCYFLLTTDGKLAIRDYD